MVVGKDQVSTVIGAEAAGVLSAIVIAALDLLRYDAPSALTSMDSCLTQQQRSDAYMILANSSLSCTQAILVINNN